MCTLKHHVIGIFTPSPARLLGIFAPLLICKIFRKFPPYSFIRHTFSLHVQLFFQKYPAYTFIMHYTFNRHLRVVDHTFWNLTLIPPVFIKRFDKSVILRTWTLLFFHMKAFLGNFEGKGCVISNVTVPFYRGFYIEFPSSGQGGYWSLFVYSLQWNSTQKKQTVCAKCLM